VHFKVICIETSFQIDGGLFDLLLLTSKSDPSLMPNECEKVEKKLYLKLPQVLYPTVSPATISPVEEESFSPSIAESTEQTSK
jgi:hypothetical protein